MAYKWILNGCEIEYLSKPKPIHNQSNTKHKIISKQLGLQKSMHLLVSEILKRKTRNVERGT